MKFNEKVFKLRKMKGLTQDEFAAAVGVSRQAVYKWESGQSYPEVPKLLEMKLLFDISIDDLLDDNFEVVVPEKQKKKRIPRAKKAEIEASVKSEIEEPAPKEEVFAAASVSEDPLIFEEEIAPAAAPAVEESVKLDYTPVKEELKEEEVQETEKKRGFFGRLFGRK